MSNKAVLITGASSGIGRATALEFAKAGYDVAFTYGRKADQAKEVSDIITGEYGRKCAYFKATLDVRGGAERLVEEAFEAFDTYHVLFNNAGRTLFYDIQQGRSDILDYLLELNYRTPIALTQAVSKNMVEKGIPGTILFNTSVRGKRSYPSDGVYGGLKAALERGVQSFALDLARHGIRVNCVAPGATVDPAREQRRPEQYAMLASKIPLQRLGRPQDIGNICVWLASDEASYITGQTITVDGGLGLPGIAETPKDEKKYPWLGAWDKEKDKDN